MSRIMELADAYAHAAQDFSGENERWDRSRKAVAEAMQERDEARAALVAEVEKLEAENAKLKAANHLLNSALLKAYPNGSSGAVFELWNAARAALGETDGSNRTE